MLDLSIIIPAYNRKKTLALILKALEGQSFPRERFEVIVVDDGSSDGTLAMLEGYLGPLCLATHSTGLPAGVYGYLKALNVGIARAQGTYLVFLDSDMVPKFDALEKLLAAHKAWEAKGEKVLIRAWWVRRRHPLRMWLRREAFANYHPRHALRRNKKFERYVSRDNRLLPTDATSAFISIRKDYALAVDGFAEHATCYGMDGEFQERLIATLGVRIVFEPEVYAIHGPVSGDVKAKAYKKLLDTALFRKMKRKGLSS